MYNVIETSGEQQFANGQAVAICDQLRESARADRLEVRVLVFWAPETA
jgi:hypothetical protein